MKKIILLTVLFLNILIASNEPESYKTCAPCHGIYGELSALGKSKIIKNMTKADIIEAINIFKYGVLGTEMGPLMKIQVEKLSDSQVKQIADYIGK